MTIRQALDIAARKLSAAGVDSPLLDARLLLADLLDTPYLQLLTAQDTPLAADVLARFFALVSRRTMREPLQYILGHAHFMGHAFLTAPDVLIPRQDTEALCERALAHVRPGSRVLDLCCGSGCLAISVKLAQPEGLVFAGDISEAAISLTWRNAQRLGAEINIRRGDLFAPFLGLRFDVILSNPPYIPARDMDTLQEEVKKEPALALEAGRTALILPADYRKINRISAPRRPSAAGIGRSSGGGCQRLVPPMFSRPIIHNDLSGLPAYLKPAIGKVYPKAMKDFEQLPPLWVALTVAQPETIQNQPLFLSLMKEMADCNPNLTPGPPSQDKRRRTACDSCTTRL